MGMEKGTHALFQSPPMPETMMSFSIINLSEKNVSKRE
jgi:hypothetical protein